MGSQTLIWLLKIQCLIGIATAQQNMCLDKTTFCQPDETCVSWERGCSLGANCLEPGVYEGVTECVKFPVKPPLLPKKSLCNKEEVFARGIDKRCSKPPCPPRLGYNCYPIKGVAPNCQGTTCPFGTYCIIRESCSDMLCEPKVTCTMGV